MKRLCTTCNVSRRCTYRKVNGVRSLVNSSNHKWGDDGKVCPICVRAKRKESPVKQRILELVGDDTPVIPAKVRKCIDCGVVHNNYYRCQTCFTLHVAKHGTGEDDLYQAYG